MFDLAPDVFWNDYALHLRNALPHVLAHLEICESLADGPPSNALSRTLACAWLERVSQLLIALLLSSALSSGVLIQSSARSWLQRRSVQAANSLRLATSMLSVCGDRVELLQWRDLAVRELELVAGMRGRERSLAAIDGSRRDLAVAAGVPIKFSRPLPPPSATDSTYWEARFVSVDRPPIDTAQTDALAQQARLAAEWLGVGGVAGGGEDVVVAVDDDVVVEVVEEGDGENGKDGMWCEERVEAALCALKRRRAVGSDRLPVEILQHASVRPLLVPVLSRLYSCISRLDHAVASWRSTRTVLVPKADGDRALPKSWRPIAIPTALQKCFDKVLDTGLRSVLDTPGGLSSHQAGFRERRSTTDLLMVLGDRVLRSARESDAFLVVLVDIEGAYDKTVRQHVLDVLRHRWRCTAGCLQAVNVSMACDHLQLQHSGGTEEIEMREGLRQGSPLSPLLFVAVLDPTVRLLGGCAPSPGTPDASAWRDVEFADDVLLLCHSTEEARTQLRVLETTGRLFRIRYAPAKTVAVVVRPRDVVCATESFDALSFEGSPLPMANDFTYLGVRFSSDPASRTLLHARHVLVALLKAGAAIAQQVLSGAVWTLGSAVEAFRRLGLAQVEYAAPVWAALVPRQLRFSERFLVLHRLAAAQTNFLLRLVGFPRGWSSVEAWYRADAGLPVSRARVHLPPSVQSFERLAFSLSEVLGLLPVPDRLRLLTAYLCLDLDLHGSGIGSRRAPPPGTVRLDRTRSLATAASDAPFCTADAMWHYAHPLLNMGQLAEVWLAAPDPDLGRAAVRKWLKSAAWRAAAESVGLRTRESHSALKILRDRTASMAAQRAAVLAATGLSALVSLAPELLAE